jgi:hypothetical protein
MTAELLLQALEIPMEAKVGQRIPKKMLVENGAPTAADKRQINDGIEELQWVAALKPSTVGVPVFKDTSREYLEIAVLCLMLRDNAKTSRITELIHRAIPYPVFLVRSQSNQASASLVHLRWSQGESERTVIDGAIVQVDLHPEHPAHANFARSLRLADQPKTHLHALYQRWIEMFEAHAAAVLSGEFRPAPDAASAAQRRQALADHAKLTKEIETLRALTKKEKQMNRRVEANLRLKQLEEQLAKASARL